MSEALLQAVEIGFDVLYLIAIWALVMLMYQRRGKLTAANTQIGKLFTIAFLLLAIGDTGHVGFRVLAYSIGGLEANPLLVGLGSLATAITVTFFYMIVAEIWRLRFKMNRNLTWWILMLVGLVRLIIMIPAGNSWGSVVPPFNWSMARNIPLMIQGIGIALIMLISAVRANDKFSKNISYMIFISYICYLPVILFVQKMPILGMLMMPKTLAYVAVAILAYRELFFTKKQKN